MKRLSILGSTGSIGTQTLDVVRNNLDKYRIVALSCGHNISILKKQIEEFKPSLVCVSEKNDCEVLQNLYKDITILSGEDGLMKVATFENADLVVNALMGMVGFKPTVAAINAGKNLALANKETLVSGGEIVMNLAKKKGVTIYPIDSEHSAIFQCLQGAGPNKIKRILLTASGGPFRGYTKEQLNNVTVEQALKHPNWSMGSKITIDSATMMNKGLEIIEAATLFNVDAKNITVVVHPQSAVHSAVEFEDGSIIAQIGKADMKIPIAYAISYPERLKDVSEPLDLFELSKMTFEKADTNVFECLGLAYKAIERGQSCRIVMNAANEVAVAAFLRKEITFRQIAKIVRLCMEKHIDCPITNPDEILALDKKTRVVTSRIIEKVKNEKIKPFTAELQINR